jgi:hypothetical protein
LKKALDKCGFFLYDGIIRLRKREYGGVPQVLKYIPAVYDGLAARIRKCVAFPGPTNCGWSEPWEGA